MANSSSSSTGGELMNLFNELYHRTSRVMKTQQTGSGSTAASAICLLRETLQYLEEVVGTQAATLKRQEEAVETLEQQLAQQAKLIAVLQRDAETSANSSQLASRNPVGTPLPEATQRISVTPVEPKQKQPEVPKTPASKSGSWASATQSSVKSAGSSVSGESSLSLEKLRLTGPVRAVTGDVERRKQDFLVEGLARTTTEEQMMSKLLARGIKVVNYIRIRSAGPYRAYVSARVSIGSKDVAAFMRPDFWGIGGDSRVTVRPWVWKEDEQKKTLA